MGELFEGRFHFIYIAYRNKFRAVSADREGSEEARGAADIGGRGHAQQS